MEFKAFIRFLIDAMQDALNESDESMKRKKMNRIIKNLEAILEN